VQFAGEPKRVKQQGGHFEIVNRSVEVECLPDDIPESFSLDISEVLIGQSKRASDIPLSRSMKLLSPAEELLAHVVAMRGEAATAEAEPAAAPATPEPEVIKKGKKEEEAAEEKKKK
jgi:large subunit ribosomal protein L25